MTVPVGHPGGVGQIRRDLPEGHEREPAHLRKPVGAGRFGQPVRPADDQVRGPPHHRIGRVLQVQDPGEQPRGVGLPDRRAVVGEAHHQAVRVHRFDLGRARVSAVDELAPQAVRVGRADPQDAVDGVADRGDRAESALPRLGSEALPVHIQLRPMLGGLGEPPVVNPIDEHVAGGRGLLTVGEEGDPARHVRVLPRDEGDVAVVDELHHHRRGRIDPSRSGGRDDHEHLAVERVGAFELVDHDVGTRLGGVGGLESRVDPDRFPGRDTVDRGQLGGVETSADEVAPLVAEGVPRRERLGAPGLLGHERLRDSRPGLVVVDAEHPVQSRVGAPGQHTVDEHEHHQHHQQRTERTRGPRRYAQTPHQLPRDDPREFAQAAPGGDQGERDGGGEHQGPQIPAGRGALGVHQRGQLALLPRREHQRHQRREHGGDRDRHLDRPQHGQRRWPPRPLRQQPVAGPADGTSHPVADGDVDAADQPLEQPVARQQRRSQRPAEEQGREGDAGEIQAQRPPHLGGMGVAVTEFGDRVDDPALPGLYRRQPIDLGTDHRSPEQRRKCALVDLAQFGRRDREQTLHLDGVGALVDDPDPHPRHVARRAHAGEAGLLGARHRHQHPAGGLGEQGHERVRVLRQQDPAAGLAGQRGLDDRLRETALGQVVGGGDQAVARGGGEDLGEQPLPLEVDLRRDATEVIVLDLRPDRAVELVAGLPQQDERLARLEAEAGGDAAVHVVDHAEHGDDRGRQDRSGPGLVVEADVAAGDGNAELRAPVGETAHGLLELPHHARILGRAEVQAVGHGLRGGTGDGDVAVGLGEGELRAGVRVELGVAARSVGGERDPAAGLLVDADHARVGVLGEHRVAADVAVVLLGDPLAAAQLRRADHLQQGRLQFLGRLRPLQPRGGVRDERVLGLRALHRAVVHRALVRDGARRHVDDGLTVPVDDEPVAVGDLADHGGQHVPLLAHGHEGVDVLRGHDGAHALLGLAREHLGGGHAGRAHRNPLERDVHAAVAGGGQLGGRAGEAGAAEVLDADDELLAVEVEAALDEHLLGERIPHLHRRQLLAGLRGAGFLSGTGFVTVEGLRRQDGHAADAVEARARAEQDDLVARARRERQVQVLRAHRPGTQRIDQGVAGIGGVEDGFAADVGQAEGVAVTTDPADHAVDDAPGVGRVRGAEAQLVHDRDRTGTHRHDVADDAADTGRGTLVRLDVGRMVVGLDLEGDRPAVADVDDAGVLTDAREHRGPHLVGGGLPEVPQVHLGGLVGAVLGPHHRVHGQLGIRGTTAQDLPDAGVLVVLQSQLTEGLGDFGGFGGVGDGIHLR
ncbi:hypothetical protein RHRU231_760036 [Rhodococcus ruber]|uniref:Uncharacterized protein n=1 Tax=Rhodococcus ruber TaxID=1830 RepID=A0A098BRL7_9NOCA|nr:hypothetical protein RHRU231_760036 [Rhodococcus ruber]